MCALDLISESVCALRDITEDFTPEVVPSYPTLPVIARYIIKPGKHLKRLGILYQRSIYFQTPGHESVTPLP